MTRRPNIYTERERATPFAIKYGLVQSIKSNSFKAQVKVEVLNFKDTKSGKDLKEFPLISSVMYGWHEGGGGER